MTRYAAFGLNRGMFVNERTLFVCVTFYASRIGASRQSRLFQFKTAMRVMTITALHRAFKHLVMEGQIELVLDLGVAAQAKLRLADFQKFDGREGGLFGICRGNESN